MRILLVEDDQMLSNGVSLALTQNGYVVDHVRTGADADTALSKTEYDLLVLDLGLPEMDGLEVLQKWRDGHFDLVFADCHMPGMDGYDLARGIRATENQRRAQRRVPIIAYTANALAPLRLAISSWWTVEGGPSRSLLSLIGAGPWDGLVAGLVWLAVAIFFSQRTGNRLWMWIGGIGTGLTIALAWWFTYAVSRASFAAEAVQIQGMTFSGPSAEWLMRVLSTESPVAGFDFGMLPGVFLGSFLGALWGRELKVEGFKDGYSMARYIVGAMCMGFGAMLAGGCAVGAGMTGGSIFALTAWLTLGGMWLGAGVMEKLIGEPVQSIQPPAQEAPVVMPVAP